MHNANAMAVYFFNYFNCAKKGFMSVFTSFNCNYIHIKLNTFHTYFEIKLHILCMREEFNGDVKAVLESAIIDSTKLSLNFTV